MERGAESRGSITSLPDLIRRATRLAASLERGWRPASRIDELDESRDEVRDHWAGPERYQSGLSDMLAAFPPPAHPPSKRNRRSIRDSMREQVQSWPLPNHFYRAPNISQDAVPYSDSQLSDPKRRRRCCGLPIWGCILLVVVILILVAAAVVLPIYFFVIRNQGPPPSQNAAQQCQQQLACANGGRSTIINGKCSCLCSGGFTGPNCTTIDTTGCTTISLANSGKNDNFTIGDAIPRLIQAAQANFSVPLVANEILARFNSGNLSCTAENALVTFNGRATRQDSAPGQAAFANSANAVIIDGIFYVTITVVIAPHTTFTLPPTWTTSKGDDGTSLWTSSTSGSDSTLSEPPPSTTSTPTATSEVTTTTTMSSGATLPTSMFSVTEDVLDFARVAVLYIMQQDNLADAELAQLALQRFFSSSNTMDAARNVPIGGGQSVDLVDFVINMGASGGKVGAVSSVAARGRIIRELQVQGHSV